MMRAWAKALLAGLALAAAGLGVKAADARVDASSGYSKAQTYSGALRYLRVDLGYEVVEKDPEAAYLIFKYVPPGQAKAFSTGTLEVIEVEGRVRLFVSLPRLPEYHERVFRDGLLRKLREEYGAAPPTKKPKAAEPNDKQPNDKQPDKQPDAGAGNGSSGG